MNSKAVTAIFMVYLGCGLNNVFLEYLVKEVPGCGHLITFLQFLFIAVHGFVFTSKFGTAQRKIPLRDYMILVLLFFVTSVFNNWAFNFHIPVPLHMIFRSGSLIANMIMGIMLLRKKYTVSKYLSVFMITIGIIICTLMSSGQANKKSCSDCEVQIESEVADHYFWWVIGILILTSALLLSAVMGIYQEVLASKYGKNPEEALYYTHMLSLVGFVFYANSIVENAVIASRSELYLLPVVGVAIPILWMHLIGNILSQYMCISSVYVLTTECSSLTLTLVITLRKFMSLLFSIIYFQNPFTLAHWLGTILVFVGTLIFTEVPFTIQKALSTHKKGD